MLAKGAWRCSWSVGRWGSGFLMLQQLKARQPACWGAHLLCGFRWTLRYRLYLYTYVRSHAATCLEDIAVFIGA